MKLVSTSRKKRNQKKGSNRNGTVYGNGAVNYRSEPHRGSNANNTNRRVKPAGKKKSNVKTVVIVVSVFAFIITALFIALGFFIMSLDTVFPNVWTDNINISGLTVEETKQTLIARGYEDNAKGISVTVVFPDESRFTVNGEQVGLSRNAREAAAAAFTFGREESFFNNIITYIRSIFSRTELNDLSEPFFDGSIVRELADEYTRLFNDTLIQNNVEITEHSIIIVKGTGYEYANEDEVFNLAIETLMQAVEAHEDLIVNYTPGARSDNKIDLWMLHGQFHVDAVSSQWDIETVRATESFEGRTFDLEAAAALLDEATNGATIVIPVIILEPEHTQEYIEAMLFRDILAETTTTVAGTSNRFNNVKLSAENIHETLLNPGEIFSFNEVVGRRTRERGFLEAGVFIGGRLVDGLGGGICQTSSTLYDAVLHTHLEIVERHAHGLTISYMPRSDPNVHFSNQGRDATVAWGQLDFRFRNNTDFPIRIETEVNGRELTISLIGTKLDDTFIEIEVVVLSTTAVTEGTIETDELSVGETDLWTPGQTGVRVETFQRHYSADGELISRTSVGISNYRMQQRVTRIGTWQPEHYDPYPGDGDHGEEYDVEN